MKRVNMQKTLSAWHTARTAHVFVVGVVTGWGVSEGFEPKWGLQGWRPAVT